MDTIFQVSYIRSNIFTMIISTDSIIAVVTIVATVVTILAVAASIIMATSCMIKCRMIYRIHHRTAGS